MEINTEESKSDIIMDDNILNKVDEVKYLGVFFCKEGDLRAHKKTLRRNVEVSSLE